MKHIFVIDDTGSPGNTSESITLKNDRKTYLAVFIHRDIRLKISDEVKALVAKYSTAQNPITELHFTDIINRRKEFKHFNAAGVIGIFKDFCEVMNKYSLPFFLQTITPRSLEENDLKNPYNKTIDQISLDFLFERVREFINDNNLQNSFEIIIDEGLGSKNTKAEIQNLKSVTSDNFMTFESSQENILLQVADFFAFSLNRNQMLLIKDNRSDFDILILGMINQVLKCNAVSGSQAVLIKTKEFSKKDYDEHQIAVFKELGVYEYWKRFNP